MDIPLRDCPAISRTSPEVLVINDSLLRTNSHWWNGLLLRDSASAYVLTQYCLCGLVLHSPGACGNINMLAVTDHRNQSRVAA